MVCRLVEQKGLDFRWPAESFSSGRTAGSWCWAGRQTNFQEALKALHAQAPQKIATQPRLDEAGHRIEGGKAGLFLMPSLEPCGLNQMYSQVYGTVPIVTKVGGLADTVRDADDDRASGTGLVGAPTSAGLRDALERALLLFREPRRYAAVQARGMARDFGWPEDCPGLQRTGSTRRRSELPILLDVDRSGLFSAVGEAEALRQAARRP